MADALTTIATLRQAVARFNAERRWEPFHSPKNLAMGLVCEAAEVMEHFLWVDAAESRAIVQDAARLGAVADEVADVACYVLNLANVLGIDLSDAIAAKMVKNAVKYPVPPDISAGS